MKSKDDDVTKEELPTGDLPTPDQLFMAEEQPAEMDPEVVRALNADPDYRRYIIAVRAAEEAAKAKRRRS